MRTTVTLDDDVATVVEDLRRQSGAGVSEVINRLVRAGITRPQTRTVYRHKTSDLGIKLDVTNIGEVLDLLDAC